MSDNRSGVQAAPRPYYDDGQITLYHGDCLELLPSLSADAIFTDPPYGVGVKYGDGVDDDRPDYWPWMVSAVAAMRASAPLVVFTHRVRALEYLTGWDWVGVWNKPLSIGSRMGNSCLLPHWEPIFMYGVHGLGTTSTYTSDVFTVNPQKAGGIQTTMGRERWEKDRAPEHPVPKPLTLYSRFLQSLGQQAATVLDPFAGSGTTLRAAKDLGLRAIGIEIEERFCEVIVRNLGQEVLDFGPVAESA